MTILTISDGILNGKGRIKYITFDYNYYIYECKIKDQNLLINDIIFNLSNISKIIFNFNEDLFTYNLNWDVNLKKTFKNINDMIKLFKDISNLIHKNYPNIIIFNDPNNCFCLGDKVLLYDKIKHIEDDLFSIPKYKLISNSNDLMNIDYFPVIIKITNGSHADSDKLCNNTKELLKAYNENFENKKNVFVVEYINSYIDELKCNICIRFMVSNNKLMEYYFRPSLNWNIHVSDIDTNMLKVCDLYYEKIYNNHKREIENYFVKISNVLGNGFFAYDIIYSNNKYYICEIGLKYFDFTMYDKCKDPSGKFYLDKLSFDENRLIKYYKDLLTK